MSKLRLVLGAMLLIALCTMGLCDPVVAENSRIVGNVYTATNGIEGNEVLVYLRMSNGELLKASSVGTGGTGTGGGLGNQSGLFISGNGNWLFVVNAGSNSVSVFRVMPMGYLRLTDVIDSGGERPVSVTANGDGVVYVLNAAGSGSIQGFQLDDAGKLKAIADANLPLSGEEVTAAAQIQFSPSGAHLIVTERATNLLDVYGVAANGQAEGPMIYPSVGITPFGFDFNQRNQLIVSEAFGGTAGQSAVSSYNLTDAGGLELISGSVGNQQSAACWIEISRNGKFAYSTNTASSNISGYAIDPETGELTLLDEDGITASTGVGGGPIDMSLTANNQFLYVLNAGSDEIVAFRVNRSNGQLRYMGNVASLPDGANGLIAR